MTLRSVPEGVNIWNKKFYFPSHLRLGSWVVGIMLGYLMYSTRSKKVKINKILDTALWILSISILLSIILGFYSFQQLENNQMTTFTNALFNACFRVGWSLSVAYIIFACQNGSGGIIRWFLSLKQWQPLGRIGLSIYLVHRIYQIITTSNQKQPIYWDFFTQVQKFYGDVLVSIFFGSILYLAVEAPVMIIENYLNTKIHRNKNDK